MEKPEIIDRSLPLFWEKCSEYNLTTYELSKVHGARSPEQPEFGVLHAAFVMLRNWGNR